MAAVADYFTLGSTVWCRTCYNREIEGEVMAFDPQVKMLVLKCPSSSGDNKLNDVQIVNLSYVSELQVKKEVTATTIDPQSVNLQRLNTRVRNQVDNKRRILQAISANVSVEGQSLFIQIAKTIKEVRWRNSDIVIFNQEVIITPPYQLENIKGDTKSREYNYIKKLVEKHMKDTMNNTTGQTQVVQNSSSPQ